MDRNSTIGLTLIAVLLFVYFYFFSPAPVPVENQTTAQKPAQSATSASPKDSARQTTLSSVDTTLIKSLGSLGSFMIGAEEFVSAENDVLKITLTNNATVSEVNLKKFKTYHQKPLLLANGKNNHFSLMATYEGKPIDLYQLHYRIETTRQGDSTQVIFSARLSDNAFIKHIYSIPAKGYEIGYSIESQGLGLNEKEISFHWVDLIPLQEKDITDSRNRTTINYYTTQQSFKGLSESSSDVKTIGEPMKWVAIKQKFFVSAILAKNNFSSGAFSIFLDAADSSLLKKAEVSLTIPAASVTTGQAKFTYYFGPNDYDLLRKVTDGFSRNVYLGWPPVIWVNQYLARPVFQFLQSFIGNYGLIIFLLVLFMKLLLTPLTYSSMLGQAKMRLLKPELDIIKAKNGDNMAQAQQDQMKLYQQAGVNPFSGCIPILLQFPIILSMFYLFPNAIELRQQHFLWAEDLSTYDSIIHLPFKIPFGFGDHVSLFLLLMTASQLVFQWQNNQLSSVEGPMKMMGYFMPVIFMFVLNSFSAGLNFYYFVSNLITFAQQAVIKRFVDEDKIMAIMNENRKKAASGTAKKSKFMAKLEEAMKTSEAQRKAKK
ncbi:MAG: Inner membrane protein translocase and chaperone YidC, long form [Cytophagales bacterium]|jgi:YidC/Oxa1 family membrane protein insertase|nr:membrane protein insertase YidC [Bacteroidota bacterium]MBS1982183.1 membrane protein insertase YidC [Bacteroidota bacterium]WHZ09529.1 MAG: Inner membrane protein translocase and chaperone YidC, long form [Cytophagales bacterium]